MQPAGVPARSGLDRGGHAAAVQLHPGPPGHLRRGIRRDRDLHAGRDLELRTGRAAVHLRRWAGPPPGEWQHPVQRRLRGCVARGDTRGRGGLGGGGRDGRGVLGCQSVPGLLRGGGSAGGAKRRGQVEPARGAQREPSFSCRQGTQRKDSGLAFRRPKPMHSPQAKQKPNSSGSSA